MLAVIVCQLTYQCPNLPAAATQTDKQQWLMSLFIQNSALNATR